MGGNPILYFSFKCISYQGKRFTQKYERGSKNENSCR